MQALSPAPHRFDRLDALRGLAIVWMAVFHFCYDLNHFRLLQPVQRFLSDPFWTTQRTAIVTLFLDRKSTRLNSSHSQQSRMPSSA